MSYELLKTQLLPPLEAGALLPRDRLVGLASLVLDHRVAMIQAAAGFGKTSLMVQWFQHLRQQNLAVAWLSIDSHGLSPVDLLAYIGAAVATAIPEISEPVATATESRRYQTADAFATTLVNLLHEANTRVVLFVDDSHCLGDDSVGQLARFVEIAPRRLHVVLASRSQIDIGLAALRARGQLLEIGMDALRFTEAETAQYVRSSGWGDKADAAIELLERRTDGWITGIKLASLAFRAQNFDRQVLLNYSGSNLDVSDYFAEQVLATQPTEVKHFLLKTSLLDRFCADLCDHALNTDKSRGILDTIEASGLFLIGLDRDRHWYRYHPLFRDFLARQLSDSSFKTQKKLMRRAADWLEQRGQLSGAIELLLRIDEADAAALILERCSQDWTYKGRINLVTQYVERIPRDVLNRYPTILLTWVWHLMRHLDFEQSRALLDQTRELIEAVRLGGHLTDAEFNGLRHQLLHREMTLAAVQDNTPLVETQCQELLSFAEGSLHPYLQGSVYSQLLYAKRDQFQMHEIEALAAKARGILDRSGYDFALIAVLSIIGTSLYVLGKADAALQAIGEAVEVARRYGGENSELVALAELPLAAIVYERNDIKRAEDILARQLANATDWGLVDQFIAGYVSRIRILAQQGDDAAAEKILDEGMALALDRNLERFRLSLVCEKLRLMSICAGVARQRIVQYGRAAGIIGPAESMLATPKSRGVDEFRATAWVRVAFANDASADAIHVAKSWRRFCELRGAQYCYVRWSILLAQALMMASDVRMAQRVLREAIAVAATMGMCRSFLDEGQVIQSLLENCYHANAGSSHPTDVYALKLLEAFGSKPTQREAIDQDMVYGNLGDREIEVLLQVSLGMRNREVAERLGMTEGSIKWYMQQIFDKLGTRSRLQAVERARKLGLIS